MNFSDTLSGSIMAVDIERFGDPHRDNLSGYRVIEAFYRILRAAFAASSVPWEECTPEDRGDGAIVFVPARFATVVLLDPFLGWLSAALAEHNREAGLDARFRLRLALHRGEVLRTEHGHTGNAIVLAARLLDAAPLRAALRQAATDLAVIVSETVYDEVVRHGYRGVDPSAYHPVSLSVKRTRARAWLHVPGGTAAPAIPAEPAEPGPEPAGGGGLHVTGTARGPRSIGVKIDRLEWR